MDFEAILLNLEAIDDIELYVPDEILEKDIKNDTHENTVDVFIYHNPLELKKDLVCYDKEEGSDQCALDTISSRKDQVDSSIIDENDLVTTYLDDLCVPLLDDIDFNKDELCLEEVSSETSKTITVKEEDKTSATTTKKAEDGTQSNLIDDDFDSVSSNSSSGTDVTISILENSTGRSNFFNVKRVLPSSFEDHELTTTTQKRKSLSFDSTNREESKEVEMMNESPNIAKDEKENDLSGTMTANLESTLFVFQKLCSITQKQGQKIQIPAMIKLLRKTVQYRENIEQDGVSWRTFKSSLKLKYERSCVLVKIVKKQPIDLVTSILNKDIHENSLLVIYGQTGSHSMLANENKGRKVMCYVNEGILYSNLLISNVSCNIAVLGLSVFSSKSIAISFPLRMKEDNFFRMIYGIKLVSVKKWE